jgi:hypothetical protein
MRINKINKILLMTALTSSLFFSCTEADNVIDQITDDTTRGAILRTIKVVSNELPIGTAGAAFAVDLEIQDSKNGDLVETVEVYVGFKDKTIEAGGANFSKSEVAIGSIPRSAFEKGPILPRTSYSVGLAEMQTALSLSDSNINGGDQFTVRFELVLTDGRRFSRDDNSATMTGSFFRSPFLYTATVVCPATAPSSGDWKFSLTDAYGDGWNGASFEVSLNGSTPISLSNVSAGTEEYTVNVPQGTQSISIVFRSGSYDGEIAFTVTAANGNVLLSQNAYAATRPVAGLELINYCIKNF